MYIASNSGDFECNNIEEFTDKLKECFKTENGNEIWCSIHKDEEFPCIALLVGQAGAVVNFFSENNEEQFVSVGSQEKEEVVEFLGGRYEIDSCQIISNEKAIECALEFFKTRQKPEVIKWDEL